MSAKPIVMRAEYAFCPNLTIIDTPGFVLKVPLHFSPDTTCLTQITASSYIKCTSHLQVIFVVAFYEVHGHTVCTSNSTDNFGIGLVCLIWLAIPTNHADCHFKLQSWSWDGWDVKLKGGQSGDPLSLTWSHRPSQVLDVVCCLYSEHII